MCTCADGTDHGMTDMTHWEMKKTPEDNVDDELLDDGDGSGFDDIFEDEEPDEYDDEDDEDDKPREKMPLSRKIGIGLIVVGIVGVCLFAASIIPDLLNAQRYRDLSAAYTTAAASEEVSEGISQVATGGIDWDALRAQNSDIVGWVQLDGTSIDHPVVQTDNNWYYVRHSFWNQWSWDGCPFADYRCDPNGRNVVIYGHHMGSSNVMFSQLYNGYTQGKFDTFGTLRYSTPEMGTVELTPIVDLRVYETYGPVQQFDFKPTDAEVADELDTIIAEHEAAGDFNALHIDSDNAEPVNFDGEESEGGETSSADAARGAVSAVSTDEPLPNNAYEPTDADRDEARECAESKKYREWLVEMAKGDGNGKATSDDWEERLTTSERVVVLVCCSSPYSGQPWRNLLICSADSYAAVSE